MDYVFPIIRHINDVLPHIEGYPEFNVLVKDGGYTVIDYAVDNPEIFSRSHVGWEIRRECRGLIFETATGKLIRRAYNKFFNVNQTEETQVHNLRELMTSGIRYLMKEDGSMVSPFVINGKVFWGTRRGLTDQIGTLTSEIDVSVYANRIRYFDTLGYTLIFEYVSPNNRNILKYDTPKVILTGVRDRLDGRYVDFHGDPAFSDFEQVERFRNVGMDIDAIVERIRTSTGIEGVIGCLPSGHRFKLKGEEYVFLHKSKERASSEREVWNIILNGEMDDMIPFLDETDVVTVKKIEVELWQLINKYVTHIEDLVKMVGVKYDSDPKRVALEWEGANAIDKGLVFKAIRGSNIIDDVVDIFHKTCSQNKKQEEWKAYVMGI